MLLCTSSWYPPIVFIEVSIYQSKRHYKYDVTVDYLAINEAIKAVKPGVTCGQIDSVARQVIRENGYEKYEHKFQTGHQLGYGLHGAPAINRNVEYVLKPGMVMCIEPRVTIFDKPEVGGVHLEETVLVTENGHERLSKLPFDESLLS